VENILEKAKRVCEEAEVFSVSREETPVRFETNRLKHLEMRQSGGTALRIIKDGRVGFSATTRQGEEEELIERALEVAQFGAPAKFQMPQATDYPQVQVYDPGVEGVSLEEMVNLGQSLIDRVREANADILCEAVVVRSVVSLSILNTRGGQASYKKSVFGLGIEGTLIRGTDMLFVGESESSCHPISDFKPVADATIEQLELAKDVAVAPSGQIPVIFTHRGVASALILPLAMGFNGRTVLQGASPVGGRLGQRVFHEKFSLWDDATIDYQPGSRLCDDEGVASQRTPLVENGVVASFLYDLQTAGMANTRSTGNGDRSLTSLPSPSVSTLIIGEGEVSYKEMVADMEEGLIVEQLMGAGQGNVLGGEFSGNVLLGYKVEKGRIVGRVKDTMVSGNVYQALADLVAVGSEARWVGGMLRTPALYVRRLSVSSKA
jgi:PmbA protein